MGEYWKPVNVTKREYVHPHQVGDGLKLGEWYYTGSKVMTLVGQLLDSGQWSESDEIRIVSDYGGEIEFRRNPGERPSRTDYDGFGHGAGGAGYTAEELYDSLHDWRARTRV